MRTIVQHAVWLANITVAGVSVAAAQATPTSPPDASAQTVQYLKQMSAYLESANAFTFHANITFEHVLPSGQKLQFMAEEEVALQRPDRLFVQWAGDLGNRLFWYDGKAVTLYDPATPFYGSESAPAGIDVMLDKVEGELGFSPPLADLLYSNPYGAVQGNIQFGLALGESGVNGQVCRSFAFTGKDVDWQIWISTGPQLTPCKLVITYKAQPGQPQFSAVFTDWNFSPRIADAVFTPDLPAGVQKIPFTPILASTQTK
ncbi:MAG: DUF2092 domain-containing protein [Rhodopila sp.]